MKTIEEKAKAYDEALERAKAYHRNELTGSRKEMMEYIFPQLCESEDEKIRKKLVNFLTDVKNISEDSRNSWAVRKGDAEMCATFLAYLERQKEQKPIKVYRVENEDEQKGLWRKFDGTWEPLFNILTDGLCRNLPMEDNDLYRAEGKKWFASAPSRETLQKWFSKRDLEELTAAGFTISEFEVTNYKKVSEFEYIFTRDSIINRAYLTVSDIYPEQKPAEWSEEDESELTTVIYCVSRAIKASKDENERNSLLNAKKWLQDKLSFRVKSLRPFWKPSDEQMEALKNVIRITSSGKTNDLLRTLFIDLEKLI